MMSDDMKLVREFAANGSEPAFATLVQRHLSLVHSAAMRQVSDAHLTEEIAQAVFIILARKARLLGPQTILSAWLYRTTRYAAADALKSHRRRQHREQEAHMQSILNEPSADTWAQLAPLLDDAMAELGESDRSALVLRFFEKKTAREIAEALCIKEGAVQKRLTRGVEKLRKYFAKRGVTQTAVAIGLALTANSVQAAPVGLAAMVTATAAKGAAASGSTLIIVKGTLKLMTQIKFKFAGFIGAFLLTGGLAAIALSGSGTGGIPDNSNVEAFKRYLSTPPNIAKLVYSESRGGNRYVAAVSKENFFRREIKSGENPELRISRKNMMRSPLFVGRFGETRWQIVGFDITKAINADANQPDPYTSGADLNRLILNRIVTLCAQTAEPGAFVWKGNEFEVPLSQAYEKLVHAIPPLPKKFTGKIIVKNGLVTGITGVLQSTFEYDRKGHLPKGIPSKIIEPDGSYITIHELVLADEKNINPEIFRPEFYVTPELAMLTVISNGVPIIKPKTNKMVDQIILDDLQKMRKKR